MARTGRRQVLKAGVALAAIGLPALTACTQGTSLTATARPLPSSPPPATPALPAASPTARATASPGASTATATTPSPVATTVPTSGAIPTAGVASTPAAVPLLLATNAAGEHLSYVDPAGGVVARVAVGAAPWGIALGAGRRAYVTTAEGIAVVDTGRRERVALIPYQTPVGPPQYGEYRPGGMGIAAAPDGGRVYAGVYLAGGPSRLDILDTARLAVVASVPIGLRPFDVLVGRDGREVYTIDHDSYAATVVDAAALTTRTLPVAPLGRGAYDKPHYGALRPDGRLLLPFQGRALAELDPASGAVAVRPLRASTHQHGVALTPGGRQLLIVGTGPAGSVAGAPSLTILDLEGGDETIIPLARPHELVVLSPDGRLAYLSGGYLLGGGWDGITIVDLARGSTSELPIPDRPLGLAFLPA